MLTRIRNLTRIWNPDWDDRRSLANLDRFGQKHYSYSQLLCMVGRRPADEFGGALYELLDREFRRGVAGPSIQSLVLMQVIQGILSDKKIADEFWKALCEDAKNLTCRRLEEHRPRSVWGVTPINGLQAMAAADRNCGISASTVVFGTYYTSSDFDINLGPHQNYYLTEQPGYFVTFRQASLIWALLRFDFFNIYSDRGFIEPVGGYGSDRFGIALEELDLYKRAGKKFYPYVYGADYRTRNKTLRQGKYNFCMDCPEVGKFCICDDKGARLVRAKISEYSTQTVAAHLSMNYVPGARNMYSLVIDTDKIVPQNRQFDKSKPLRVGHFTNHGFFKGTEYLEAAYAKLQATGHNIELVLLTGLSNTEILEAMGNIDVLVDQLIGGSFGLTALEAMARGVPVICYLKSNVEILEKETIPIIQSNPATIEKTLRKLAKTDRADLREIGRKSREYVLRNYSVQSFSARLADLYADTAHVPETLLLEFSKAGRDYKSQAHADAASWSQQSANGDWAVPKTEVNKSRARKEKLGRLWIVRRQMVTVLWRYARRIGRSLEWRISQYLKNRRNEFIVIIHGGYKTQLIEYKEIIFAWILKHKANFSTWILKGKANFSAWILKHKTNFSTWVLKHKTIFSTWVLKCKTDLSTWTSVKKRAVVAKISNSKTKASFLKLMGEFHERFEAALLSAAKNATQRRLKKGRLRTLWGVTPILTLPILARCDRLLGLRSHSLVFVTYYISSAFDINLTRLDKMFLSMTRGNSPINIHLFRKWVLRYCMWRYDVFHYFYDRGILIGNTRFGIATEELDLLKKAGKRVYTYAYGADVRGREATLALGTPNLCQECPQPGVFCICDRKELSSSMNRLKGRVTQKISMGDMIAYVPGCRNMHYWPIDTDRFQATPLPSRINKPLRVAHAPNHPHFKGTRFLLSAIKKLQEEGHAIELVQIQGVPNEEVIELFKSCHVVADQFVAGFHGYTALEAMALGRPVMCFLRGPDMVIDPDTCPILNTNPDTVYSVLKGCVTGKIDIEEFGRSSRAYVDRYYSLPAIAVQLGKLYCETGEFPQNLNQVIQKRVAQLESTLRTNSINNKATVIDGTFQRQSILQSHTSRNRL